MIRQLSKLSTHIVTVVTVVVTFIDAIKTARQSTYLRFTALSVVLGCSPLSFALPEDSQQPINVKADTATQKVDQDMSYIIYTGNVIMTQGSLLIEADHLTVTSKNKKVQSLLAKGKNIRSASKGESKRAHFQQQSDPNKLPVKAKANTIRYELSTEIANFIGDAMIEQEGSIITGEQIAYSINTEKVQARGNIKTGVNNKPKTRVEMILVPETNEAKPPADNSNPTNVTENPSKVLNDDTESQ